MSTHKHIDKICIIVIIAALAVTLLFINGEKLGIEKASSNSEYTERLFDTSKVHTIDIVMDDWDGFIETCENEEYAACSVVIDGEAYSNVGIRAKGNTSLSSVSRLGSDRYSFKIEFDQYDDGKTYYGLDKLSLNNIIQDNTYMKDYLCYQLMNQFGVNAPLCSYVYITVNGEDWGLYLAAEAVEDGFLSRNYGSDTGELYKPDSASFGGGRGNGRDFDFDADASDDTDKGDTAASGGDSQNSGDSNDKDTNSGSSDSDTDGREAPPEMSGENTPPEAPDNNSQGSSDGGRGSQFGDPPEMPDKDTKDGAAPNDVPNDMGGPDQMPGGAGPDDASGSGADSNMPGDAGQKENGGAMGSADVKLQYIDHDPASYSNIFDNAKTDITDTDKTRLIQSLKALSENKDIDSVVDAEQVIRYFVVHNFVCNGDSYTGSMIHNYYLYEKDGQLSMIPWDYNLAFGGFQAENAASVINEDIDDPVTSGDLSDRPMLAWIFADETYTELYHQYFSDFISQYCEDGQLEQMISDTAALIAPYVEKDPTKFCTCEEFETGVETLLKFCQLRGESISLQLSGSDEEVDASELNLSDMGSINSTMNGEPGGGNDGGMGDKPGGGMGDEPSGSNDDSTNGKPGDSNDGQSSQSEFNNDQQSADNDQQFSGPEPPDAAQSGGNGGSVNGKPGSNNDDSIVGKPGGEQADNNNPSSEAPQSSNPGTDGNMPSGPLSNQSTGANAAGIWILLTVSAAILLAGLAVAIKYRR